MNYVSLLGRLTRDPEVSYTSTGKAYTRFSLAVTREINREETDFINCIAWEKRAELIGQYFKKGSRILIQGRIQTGSYEKDGEKRNTFDVVINNIEFVDSKTDSNSSSSYSKPVEREEISIEDEDDFPF